MANHQISEAALNEAMVRELCSGRKFMETRNQKLRDAEWLAAKEARAMRGNKGKNLKFVGSVPAAHYFRVAEEHGHEFWEDRGEVKRFFDRCSHLKSANL